MELRAPAQRNWIDMLANGGSDEVVEPSQAREQEEGPKKEETKEVPFQLGMNLILHYS